MFFTVLPKLGKSPDKMRMIELTKSNNFRNGLFQNSVETLMEIPPYEVMKEMMKKRIFRVPKSSIPTVPISKNFFEIADPSEILISWLGHSTLLLKIDGKTILIDPVFSKRASFTQLMGPKQFDYSHQFSIEELPPIDIVLISHDHYDHLDYNVIKKLAHSSCKFYAPLGVGSHLKLWGVKSQNICELDWWESSRSEGISFTATPARHFTGRSIARFKTFWCGWAIKTENQNIFFSGDSGYFDGFKKIGEKLGPFDLSILECGQYSKYWSSIHMMPEESVQAAIDVRSKRAMPIHWGKFNLSIHAWNEPPLRFIKRAEELKLPIIIPKIGETFSTNSVPEITNWFQ